MTCASLDAPTVQDYIEKMVELAVSLPTDLQRYVEARVAAEGFADHAEFIRDLVQRDQDAYEADVLRVRALIREGTDSGIVDAEPDDILDDIIARICRPHG